MDLRQLREKKGFSKNEAARRLQTSPSLVTKWENGSVWPGMRSVGLLAPLYGVTFETIALAVVETQRKKEARTAQVTPRPKS